VGTPRAITHGDGNGSVRVEHVKSRGVIRLTTSGDVGGPLELPVRTFLDRLGVELDDLSPPTLFLLFADHRQSLGPSAVGLVGAYQSEAHAHHAFLTCRRDPSVAWAELLAVRGSGSVERLAWFEVDSASGARGVTAGPPRAPRVSRPARLRVLFRSSGSRTGREEAG
jgi:hypothetical protein